jgi:Acyl-CoA dehydrogenases
MENRFSPCGGAFLLAPDAPRALFTPEDFSPESRLVGEAAEDFLKTEVLPHVARIEEGDHDLMHALMRKAGELGLLGADVPAVYGGLGLDVPTAALIARKPQPPAVVCADARGAHRYCHAAAAVLRDRGAEGAVPAEAGERGVGGGRSRCRRRTPGRMRWRCGRGRRLARTGHTGG